MKPTLFLDIDDVLCVGPYRASHVIALPEQRPHDLWERLWDPASAEVLRAAIDELEPRVVISSGWLRLLPKGGFKDLFRLTGLPRVADSLHEAWDAPQNLRESRLAAIERWLDRHHRGEAFVVLDDYDSGTGLPGSWINHDRRLVLCNPMIGLEYRHLPMIREALTRPAKLSS